MDEANSRNSDSMYYRIYLLVLGVYAAIRLAFGLLVKIPACHKLSEISDRYSFFQFFKWIYEVVNIAK
jgi:callose synthase